MELNQPIDLRVDTHLALITINRPDTRNALDDGTIAQLIHSFESAFSDPDVRVVALRSRGDVYCSGMDLSALASDGEPDRDRLRAAIAGFERLLRLIMTGPKPVIAVVHGSVRAGGVGLAGACDLVLATAASEVQLGEVVFGLIPANIMPVLVGRRISMGVFRSLALTGIGIDAAAAADCGLYDSIFDDRDALESGVRRLIKQLYRTSPDAVATLKRLMDEAIQRPATIHRRAKQALFDRSTAPETLDAIVRMQAGDTPAWFDRFRPTANIVLSR